MGTSTYRVIVGSASWQLNGVNIFTEHLVRGLVERGIDARIFFTEHDTWLVQLPKEMMPFPHDLPCVNIQAPHKATWETHWYETLRYIESQAPCIYLPNSDFRHSCITPLLSSRVAVVGLIQGDDPIHYEHVHRLGAYWDGIVCVSEEIGEKVVRQDPSYRDRVHVIPNTVVVPADPPPRVRQPGDPVRIVYHGVLNTYQKRILHIAEILAELDRRQTPFRLTIAGDGPQRDELLERCHRWIESGAMEYVGIVPHHEVDSLLRRHDAYIMTSAFEGMPHAVLEAMAQGCVPVVTRIDSGIPELVTDGLSGYLVPVGDCATFADRFSTLQREPERLEAMSLAAHSAIKNSRFNVDAMVEAYLKLFDHLLAQSHKGRFQRPNGKILPPPAVVNGLSIFPCETGGFIADVEKMLAERPVSPPSTGTPKKGIVSRLWRRFRRR